MNTIIFFLILISWYDASPQKHLRYINSYVVYEDICQKGFDDFMYELGFRESTNRYYVVNKYGYLGRYQFSYSTLRNLGFNVTKSDFLKDELIQDQAFVQLLLHNKQLLNKTIHRYDSTYVNGIFVTESGILAAAHLLGPRRVKRYLETGEVSYDALGTSIYDYMTHFSGYQLNI